MGDWGSDGQANLLVLVPAVPAAEVEEVPETSACRRAKDSLEMFPVREDKMAVLM
jgi:hypothetical protein